MSFPYTRKPDFRGLAEMNYDAYWLVRDSDEVTLRNVYRERESIFINWVQPNSRVLDIGCGDSPVLRELKEQKNCQVEGMDISALAVEAQKQAGVPARVGNVGAADFLLDQHYDYIIMSELLEHLPYPEKLLINIKSHSRYFIVSIPNSAYLPYRLGLLIHGRFFTQWAVHPAEHLRFWSHLDFLDWSEALGFRVARSEASNGLRWRFLHFNKCCPNLFGHQICYLMEPNPPANAGAGE
jgi:methionine biosynthesis protein MetW